MARSIEAEGFLRTFVEALKDDNAAVFAGAGLSIPAGLVDWRELLRDIAGDVGLDVDKEQDLVAVAQYHVNERRGRHRINQALVQSFAERAGETENHRLLAALPIRTYWTTNYDTLIEDALRRASKRPDVKRSVLNLATTTPKRDAVIYKMHGDISDPDSAVVTKDDYESYDSSRQLFSTTLQGDLVSKTFLFLGFSFNDPNLGYILGRIRVLLGQSRREHYALMRRVARSDFVSEADFAYARAKQDLQVRDLRRYGIVGVLVDEYNEYTSLLREVWTRYRLNWAFVSGSAADYAPWDHDSGPLFLRELGRTLIQSGLGVVSGFGLGVGPYLLNGVLDAVESEGLSALHDRVILRPFPQGIEDPHERSKRWTLYRQQMLRQAGIVVIAFGNRSGGSGTELSPGVEEEFRIAVSQGAYVIPLGCTGGMAARLHAEVVADFERFFPNLPEARERVVALGSRRSDSQILEDLRQLVRLINRRQ